MNTFEQRLVTELKRLAGPRRPVDARSIRQAAMAPSNRARRLLSRPRRARDIPVGAEHVQPARTRATFNWVGLAAVVAILALAGGLLYSGILTVKPGPLFPGAAERTDFIIVTGTSTVGGGTAPTGDDSMSDPRASGHVELTNQYLIGPEDLTGMQSGQYTLTNDGGTWEGEWIGFYESPGADEHTTMTGAQNGMAWASGTGDYEGWSYIANYTGDLTELSVKGLLVQGEIPPTVALGLLEAGAE